MKLKKRDRKLLYYFCNNSKLSYSALGKKAGISQQLVQYKISTMLEEGLIHSVFPVIDYSRFGLLNFKVHFRVNFRSKKTFQNLLSWLTSQDNVVGVMERGGKYDIIVSFADQNPSSFNKQLKNMIEKNPEQLKNHMILTNVVSHHFPLKYLISEKANKKDMVIGGDRKPLKVNKKEKVVLKELITNPRTPSVQIAKKAKIDPRTVISIIKNLQKEEIVRGFSALLSTDKTGYRRAKMLIRYHNLSVESENKLVRFCMSHPNIVNIHKLFGGYDLEITGEGKNMEQLRSLFIKVRENFEDIIQDSDTFQIFKVHKRKFLPKNTKL